MSCRGLSWRFFTPNTGFQLLLPIFAAVVLGGIGSAYGAPRRAAPRRRHGAFDLGGAAVGVDPVYKPVVAFVVLIGVLLVRPQGLEGRGSCDDHPERRVLGLRRRRRRHLHDLRARRPGQFGFTGLLNFGQVAFMAIGAYTMAILTVKTDVGMWAAA